MNVNCPSCNADRPWPHLYHCPSCGAAPMAAPAPDADTLDHDPEPDLHEPEPGRTFADDEREDEREVITSAQPPPPLPTVEDLAAKHIAEVNAERAYHELPTTNERALRSMAAIGPKGLYTPTTEAFIAGIRVGFAITSDSFNAELNDVDDEDTISAIASLARNFMNRETSKGPSA